MKLAIKIEGGTLVGVVTPKFNSATDSLRDLAEAIYETLPGYPGGFDKLYTILKGITAKWSEDVYFRSYSKEKPGILETHKQPWTKAALLEASKRIQVIVDEGKLAYLAQMPAIVPDDSYECYNDEEERTTRMCFCVIN